VVAFGDLDLTTEAGRATLETRLRAAERTVCGSRPWARDLRTASEYRHCIVAARASYQEQVRLALDNANGRRAAILASGRRFPG
jgi:UrcA family protein